MFTERLEFDGAAAAMGPFDAAKMRMVVDEYYDRLRRANTLCTFVRANGQPERIWSLPWTIEPSDARVLVTPPPWSTS